MLEKKRQTHKTGICLQEAASYFKQVGLTPKMYAWWWRRDDDDDNDDDKKWNK